MAVVTMKQLLDSGTHFGHQTRRWNPKMKRFIFTDRNGIYIIDLQQTLTYIDKAYEVVKETVAHGGSVMFIGTKKQAQESIAEEATRVGMPYVNQRWLGGMLTIGWAWKSDYGSSENPDEFKALYAYSPYHNLKPGTHYPPTMVTTADHDDRVVPAHSFKFAARLQECQAGPAPVLIRIESKAGHGAGKPITKQVEERSDQLGFLVQQFGMEGIPASGK